MKRISASVSTNIFISKSSLNLVSTKIKMPSTMITRCGFTRIVCFGAGMRGEIIYWQVDGAPGFEGVDVIDQQFGFERFRVVKIHFARWVGGRLERSR